MTLQLAPASPEDVPALLKTGMAAFADTVHRLYFHTLPLSQESIDKMVLERQKAFEKENNAIFKVVDSTTGKPVAGSKWVIYETDTEVKETVQQKLEPLLATAVPEARTGLLTEFKVTLLETKSKLLGYTEDGVFKLRKRIDLDSLYTHPEYQGRGAAKLLLNWGFEKADELGLDIYLEATAEGKPVYERYGFKEVTSFDVDGTKYGAHKVWTTTVMIRSPVPKKTPN